MNEGGTPYSPKRLKTTRWGTRAAAWALVAALLIPMLNWARVYAAETPEGGLCVHHPAHTPDCGFVEASLGSPCSLSPDTGLPEDQVYTPGSDALPEHVHDETCGYAPAQEGHPCTYLCPYCVSGWEWNNPEEMLAWNEDAKLWGLGLPGASESMPVTREMLAELLPQSATISTLDGKKSEQALAWDLSAVPETGAAQGRFSVSASLPEPFVLTSSAPTLSVLVDIGEGEVLAVYKALALNEWTWEGFDKQGTDVVIVVNIDGITTPDQLVTALQHTLPKRIYGSSSGDKRSIELAANDPYTFIKYESPKSWGYLRVNWDTLGDQVTTKLNSNEFTLNAGQQFTVEASKPTRTPPAKYFINNVWDANSTETMPITVRLESFLEHTVPAASPENVKVNLFDYCVDSDRDGAQNKNDILTKSDWHKGETTDNARTSVEDWNKGINKGRLLLFGDGLIHAGLWNKGAGAITNYGKAHAGMTGIVAPVLPEDGYPVINANQYDQQFSGYTGVTDYKLAGDPLPSNDPKRESPGIPYTDIDRKSVV